MSLCFLSYLLLLLFVDFFFLFTPSSISVQAAKLQWSLDEKVGSSRGTRVSRPFVCVFSVCVCCGVCVCLCGCVALLSGSSHKLPDISSLRRTTVQPGQRSAQLSSAPTNSRPKSPGNLSQEHSMNKITHLTLRPVFHSIIRPQSIQCVAS